MKIRELLTEAVLYPYEKKRLPYEKLNNLFQTDYSEAFNNLAHSPIWRGRNGEEDILLLDPSKGMRKSQNTTNYYTELMDNSPYMQGWPKRSRSFICSTNQGTASFFGEPYAMFPKNGTLLGVCPAKDLWNTKIDLSRIGFSKNAEWDTINRIFERPLDMRISDFDYMVDRSRTEEFAELLKELQAGLPIRDQLSPDQFIPWILAQMKPEVVGFELISLSEFNPSQHENKELWFSAPCIAMSENMYGEWISSIS